MSQRSRRGGGPTLQYLPSRVTSRYAKPSYWSSPSLWFRPGPRIAPRAVQPGASKRTVYVLRSLADPERHYVGITRDVERRLDWHNHGPSGQTVRGRPWSVSVAMTFAEEGTARRFERYL